MRRRDSVSFCGVSTAGLEARISSSAARRCVFRLPRVRIFFWEAARARKLPHHCRAALGRDASLHVVPACFASFASDGCQCAQGRNPTAEGWESMPSMPIPFSPSQVIEHAVRLLRHPSLLGPSALRETNMQYAVVLDRLSGYAIMDVSSWAGCLQQCSPRRQSSGSSLQVARRLMSCLPLHEKTFQAGRFEHARLS